MNAHDLRPVRAPSIGVSYQVPDWREQFEACRTGLVKQIAYAGMRRLFDVEARRWLAEATLRAYSPAAVLRERGFPIEARRRWALAQLNVRKSVIFVQGTGS